MMIINEPWQKNPAELIQSAIRHLHEQSDIDQLIAFLLLDVGVESTFKTFLLLPDTVTGAKTKYFDRKSAAEGSFHSVVEGVRDAAASRLSAFNMAHVNYFHSLRNQLYHQGNGIIIPSVQVHDYAHLAVKLLRALLNVDLTDELRKPEIEARLKADQQSQADKKQSELTDQINAVKEAALALKKTAELGIEKVHLSLALPSFGHRFNEIVDEYNRLTSIGQEDGEFEKRMSDLLMESTGDPNFSVVVGSTNLTEFRLRMLQILVSRSLHLTGTHFDWDGIYNFSTVYPEVELQPIHLYDDDNNIYDEKYLTHDEIIEHGRNYVSKLKEIREAIEAWMKTVS
jgi:hypothetical protein